MAEVRSARLCFVPGMRRDVSVSQPESRTAHCMQPKSHAAHTVPRDTAAPSEANSPLDQLAPNKPFKVT